MGAGLLQDRASEVGGQVLDAPSILLLPPVFLPRPRPGPAPLLLLLPLLIFSPHLHSEVRCGERQNVGGHLER